MKILALPLLLFATLPAFAQMAMDHPAQPARDAAPELLGTVSFSVSCAPAVQAPFNRGVALAPRLLVRRGAASVRRDCQNRPRLRHGSLGRGHELLPPDLEPSRRKSRRSRVGRDGEGAVRLPEKTARERAYIAALSDFYRPGNQKFPARVQAYSDAMGKLYAQYPDDIDAGAFYALSLLCCRAARRHQPHRGTQSHGGSHSALRQISLTIPAWSTTSFTPATIRPWRPKAWLRPTTTAKSRPPAPMPLTCLATSTPALACGRRTSRQILPPSTPQRPRRQNTAAA